MAEESGWKRPSSAPVPTVWARYVSPKPMANGRAPAFIIQDYTEEWKEQIVRNMTSFFLKDEPLSRSIGFTDDAAAVEEFTHMFLKYLSMNMGLVAIVENLEELGDPSLPPLAGYNMTAVITSKDKFEKSKTRKVQDILDLLHALEEKKNCFEHYQVSEYLYALGLSVDPAYRGHGLGYEILKARFPLCKAVGLKVTVTVFTSAASQRSAEKAGFETLAELAYEDYKDEFGQLVFKVDEPKTMKLMAKRIP